MATPFAQAIFAKAQLLQAGVLTERQRSQLRESIADDFKKLGDVLFPDIRPFDVSERALKAAARSASTCS